MAGRKFKHGDKRTWELALDAIGELGGSATTRDILARIRHNVPDYVQSNLPADLAMLSVNCLYRGRYSQNFRPRRTDSGSEFDRLINHGSRAAASYEIYDAARHGVWEIYLASTGEAKIQEVTVGVAEGALRVLPR